MFELPQQNLDRAKHQEQLAQIQSLERTMVGAFSQLVQYLDGKVTKTEVINQLRSIETPDALKVVAAVQALDAHLSQNKLDLGPISEALNKAVAELQQIPKTLPELPEQTESVTVTNLPDLDKYFASLEKTIASLDLHVEAPKVDVKVPQAKITVEKPDLAPLQSLLLQVVHAVQAIKLPEAKPTDVSGVEKRLEGLGEWHDLQVKELKEANKSLKKIVEKPVSSGGGGGGGDVFQNTAGARVAPQLGVLGNLPTLDVDLAIQIDDATATVSYIGKALPGTLASAASWQIKKIDSTSGTSITWASGSSNFNQVWNNRSSLTYS